MSATGTITCGAPRSDGGTCGRRLRPGESCPDHTVRAPRDGSEPQPLRARPCGCSRPIVWREEGEVRCIRCGRDVELEDRPRSRFKPAAKPEGDPPSPFVPEQLELEV